MSNDNSNPNQFTINTYLILTIILGIIIQLLKQFYLSYVTKRNNKKSTTNINQIVEKINLVDIIIKSLNEIKSQNTLIQQSLLNHSNQNMSISWDININDLENNIKSINMLNEQKK